METKSGRTLCIYNMLIDNTLIFFAQIFDNTETRWFNICAPKLSFNLTTQNEK